MKLRPATQTDMDEIYRMGFDCWGQGHTDKTWLNTCRQSKKYAKGQWFCLEQGPVILASVILYQNGWKLPEGWYGIGSLATGVANRHKGYASILMRLLIERYRAMGIRGLLLFADIAPGFYVNPGFKLVHSDNTGASQLMMLTFDQGVDKPPSIPDYF